MEGGGGGRGEVRKVELYPHYCLFGVCLVILFVCLQKHQKCKFVPKLLSMIVVRGMILT